MDEKIITEARRIAGLYGKNPTAWEMREIVRDSRRYMDEGTAFEAAVSYAATIVLRLYGEAPPWSMS
jgi:hypothetical protein